MAEERAVKCPKCGYIPLDKDESETWCVGCDTAWDADGDEITKKMDEEDE